MSKKTDRNSEENRGTTSPLHVEIAGYKINIIDFLTSFVGVLLLIWGFQDGDMIPAVIGGLLVAVNVTT